MQVVGAASNGLDGVEVVLRTRPALVVMDIRMPGEIDGLEAMRRILAEYTPCIVLLTAFDDYREQAEQSGACGYIVKPVTYQSFIPDVQSAFERFNRA
jgi:response regulator NasT